MKFSPPAQSKHATPWEGDYIPPLRLVKGKPAIPSYGPAVKPLERRSWIWRHLLVLACVAAFSFPAYFLASRYVVTAVVIQGKSMTPTLKDGDRYYLNRWRYRLVKPTRGDLVVIKDPGHVDFAVKRIIAKPKDWLNIRDGNIFLNGKRLEEPYLPTGTRTDAPDMKEKWIQLGQDQYYVLGDNRKSSEDSRYYGVIHRAQILGVLVK
jgi:signal peptidase I